MARSLSGSGKSPRTFFDANLLVYSDDVRDPAKQQIAVSLIAEHIRQRSGVLSLQVLQEYFASATRKVKLDAALARLRVEVFANFQLVEPNLQDVLAAIDLHRLHGFSYWDALIIRCAERSGCGVLLTEDMQHGREINGVKIVNPFL